MGDQYDETVAFSDNCGETLNISVVVPMKPSRIGHLQAALPTYRHDRESQELVIVEDVRTEKPRAKEIKPLADRYFAKTQWIAVDANLGCIPVYASPWALLTNIAVKHASFEAIYGTSPECFQIGTIEKVSEVFSSEAVAVFEAYETDREFIRSLRGLDIGKLHQQQALRLAGVKRPAFLRAGLDKFWWYGVVFPRTKFIQFGGVDENQMAGYGWEDDILGAIFANNGLDTIFYSNACVIHGFHWRSGTVWADNEARLANLNRCWKFIHEKTKTANVGHNWGDDFTIVEKETWS